MKKAFDAVSWMRRRRIEIDEEDGTLTWVQKRQRTHEEVLQDPLLMPLCSETVVSGTARRMVAKKPLSACHGDRGRARRP